jgi:hypothetical protein
MIATLGPCLPIDLLEATARHSGPLEWTLGRATPKADQWLESKFPTWARSIVEDWADGRFDHAECVIFSRGDDVVQRLYYYLCELQRRGLVKGPRPVIFDVAKIPRAISAAHTMAAVRRLAQDLSVPDEALEASIAATNRRRAAEKTAPDGRPCLLIGTPPPHQRLHDAIAQAGFAPIGRTLEATWADLGPPIEQDSGDPVAAVARQVHARDNDRRGFARQADAIRDRVRATSPAAAVLWYTEEDEARIWNLPAISTVIREAGMPVLTMVRRNELAGDGALDEIRDFLQGLDA